MKFETVSADDLIRLKDELQMSNGEMADLVGLANGRQWRRYTTSADLESNGRKMSFHMLFYLAARVLEHRGKPVSIETVYTEMRRIGAAIDPDSTGDGSQQD